MRGGRAGLPRDGDGNHFAYVGHLKSTGHAALVTHHGSRGLGAQLYKRGMAVARKHTAIHAPKIPGHNAWIKASSEDGRAYWEALQIVRLWTKANHHAIHDLTATKIGNGVADRFWNEHNFVFRKADGLFYHGKGATPNWSGFSNDDDGRTIVPLNMAEPILVLKHRDNKDALGFAPHGAGRNVGRRAFPAREQAPAADRHRCPFLLRQARPVGAAGGLQERCIGTIADHEIRLRGGNR